VKTIRAISKGIEGMSAGQIAAEALLRGRRAANRTVSRLRDHPARTFITGEQLAGMIQHTSLNNVAARIRERRGINLTTGLGKLDATVALVKECFPAAQEQARKLADTILDHRIQLFGAIHEFGPSIDWHRDPVSGIRWPLRHYSKMPLMLGGASDIRVVWELNRLQHFVSLGRAYVLTGDKRYAQEWLSQIANWNESNPPRFGPNWMNAMEAAIRAISLMASLQMFAGWSDLTDRDIQLVLGMLVAHGEFIRANLEFTQRLASNHFLSDLIGLFALGSFVPELKQSAEWTSFSSQHLLSEMDRQILDDGVDYEGSVAYHRFVAEIFLLFFSMSRATGKEIPLRYWKRLELMFGFVKHYLKPDGTAPRIGDSDDGRLVPFKPRPPDDHSYLLSLAAILFDDSSIKTTETLDEEALWWFGPEGKHTFDSLPAIAPASSRAFTEGQIFIQREDELYSIIDCGDHGALGRGSHAHSDALSFELFAYGRTLIRDPGTYIYTGSEEWRNRFRSTAYHNTVQIDGQEISETIKGAVFILGSNVKPIVNQWSSDAECDLLDAEHKSYERLPDPVIHRRIITFKKKKLEWMIEDVFTGEGRHLFEFFFNLDNDLDVSFGNDNRAIIRDPLVELQIVPQCDQSLETLIDPRWVSNAYGTRVKSSAIIYKLTSNVPLTVRFHLYVRDLRNI